MLKKEREKSFCFQKETEKRYGNRYTLNKYLFDRVCLRKENNAMSIPHADMKNNRISLKSFLYTEMKCKSVIIRLLTFSSMLES